MMRVVISIIQHHRRVYAFSAFYYVCAITLTANAKPQAVSIELHNRAVHTLKDVMASGRFLANVHAAEMLLSVGEHDGIFETFEREVSHQKVGSSEYIGACRVLAAPQRRPEKRAQWINKILAVFLDGEGASRYVAAESLAKLGYYPSADEKERFQFAAHASDQTLAVFATWVLANSGSDDDQMLLAGFLRSSEVQAKANAPYALRFQPHLTHLVYQKLSDAADHEPRKSGIYVYMISAQFVHTSDQATRKKLSSILLQLARSGNSAEKLEAYEALAARGELAQLPQLVGGLDDADPDARAGAAHAILCIEQRIGPIQPTLRDTASKDSP